MTAWTLEFQGFEPENEKLREALCVLGNGYFCTRGACAETDDDGIHYPGTYLAGGYNRLKTEVAGRMIENEDLVNMPNWLPLKFRPEGGEWYEPEDVEMIRYLLRLDLLHGILLREMHFRDHEGRETEFRSRRIVHMDKPHLAAEETAIRPLNWGGRIDIRTAIDGTITNNGVARYRSLNSYHLHPVESEHFDDESIYLKMRTSQSRLEVATAARTRVFIDDEILVPAQNHVDKPGHIGRDFTIEVNEGSTLRLEKTASLYTSKNKAIPECGLAAKGAILHAPNFESLLKSHQTAWKHLWEAFDLELDQRGPDQGERTSMVLRLHIFHLLQTVSPNTMDLDVGVPPRGWHGEAYRGHIFWDELFIFPILNFRIPEITRALLKYRYRRLDAARILARREGYRGAMYPWQSGSSGREESQELHLNPKSGRWIPDNSHRQRHINAAVAYNIWQYDQVTCDSEFLQLYGAEMFLEIARFWASIAAFNPRIDRYEILGVMGPDEYHEAYPEAETGGLNNNAYTNVMAAWILDRAQQILYTLPEDRRERLIEKLEIAPEEIAEWETISRKIKIPFHEDGIISQFEGYEDLEEFDWKGYQKKYGDIQRLDRILEAENDTPNRYKASKQADVLMLFFLFSTEELQQIFERLGYELKPGMIPRNIDYYAKRTSHGSTLSNVVHSWVLARSEREHSWELFRNALESDLDDIQGGTTPEGIHLGAMSGTVDLMQRCYTGMEIREDMLMFNSYPPPELTKLCVRIRYRGHSLEIHLDQEKLRIRSLRSSENPIRIGFRGSVQDFGEGDEAIFDLETDGKE